MNVSHARLRRDINRKKVMNQEKSAHLDFFVEMAVEFWRLEKRFGKLSSFLSKDAQKAFADQMQRMRHVFEKYNIEIHDPRGEIYIDGCSLKAIYIEEVDDLPAGVCRVIETIKPSICSNGVQIFQGEVIVGQGKIQKSNKVST